MTLVRFLAGPALWALHFTALYALVTFACMDGGWLRGRLNAAIVIVTVAASAGLAWLISQTAGRRGGDAQVFLPMLQTGLAVLSLLAVIWVALPMVWLGPTDCR